MNTTATIFEMTSWSARAEDVAEDRCTRRSGQGVIVLIILPLLALMVNSIMILASYFHRSKLKRKNIYLYLYSTLIANVIFSLLACYQLLNHHFLFEKNPAKDSNVAIKTWWLFRKALTNSLFLIMIGNIGILVKAIHDGSVLVARTTATSTHQVANKRAAEKLKNQSKKTAFYLASIWIIPLILPFATLAGWSCMEVCECLSGCYTLEDMQLPGRVCSRIWTPMTVSFNKVVVAFWFLEFVVLFGLIIRTYRSSLFDSSPKPEDMVIEHNYQRSNMAATPTQLTVPTQENLSTSSLAYETSNVSGAKGPKKQEKQKKTLKRKRRQLKWLRQAAKQLFLLTIAFFVCTLPLIIAILVDFSVDKHMNVTVSAILLSLPILYTIICPFLLMKHLGGLKIALRNLFIKMTTMTTYKKKKARTSEVKAGSLYSSTFK